MNYRIFEPKFTVLTTQKKLALSAASSVLLAISWPHIGHTFFLIFFALIPFFYLEQKIAAQKINGQKAKLFPYTFLMLVIFNALTTWWVWNASPAAIAAILLNSLFMALAIQCAHFARVKLGNFRGNIALLFCWIGWEYFHHEWDLSWTWLTLGNGLAHAPYLIQWYEYTGVFGGSFWILATNILFTNWIIKLEQHQLKVASPVGLFMAIKPVMVLVIPSVISLVIFNRYKETQHPIEVVSVQPNIDPYNAKFTSSSLDQVQKMLDLAEQQITPNTQWVIYPETAIPQAFNEDQFSLTPEGELVQNFVENHPQTDVIIGASTFVVYRPGDEVPNTARTANDGTIYDYCNTATHVSAESQPQFYHKAKMVPGVEKMPFPSIFQHLQTVAFDLGGTVGSLGGVTSPQVFFKDTFGVAPIICYESVYGEFVTEFVQKGAQAIFVITNDGWWGDTPGYKQHHLYAQLRAIENRRYVVRSANTGISSIINQRGQTIAQTNWWEPTAIKGTIQLNNQLTFYTQYGDIIGRVSLAFGVLLLILAVSRGIINKDNEI